MKAKTNFRYLTVAAMFKRGVEAGSSGKDIKKFEAELNALSNRAKRSAFLLGYVTGQNQK